MRKWEEKMYRSDNEYSLSLPFFDIIFKTVAYSIVYNWYSEGERGVPEFRYLWYKGKKYHPIDSDWVDINYNQLPKRVRERFEEIKPLFYLMR